MSKVLKIIGTIAGAVALVATGVGAFAAAGSALASAASSVATIASLVSGVAAIGAALTYKPPPARGSVAQVIIAPDAPAPYVMGEVLVGGVLRHDTAYGATLNKVPNPYRFMALVLSVAGPVQAITPQVDQAGISSYYSGFLYADTQLGTCPDVALTPQWAGAPGWSTASKLSGKACIGWSLKFDKDGKKFASGVPPLAALVQGVKVYDPRLDSTFPGGSGSCRLGTESTYVYSANPALHAGTYAYGRFQNGGKKVMGVGLPAEAIDWANVAAWANVCDANSWTIAGVVYEPADRWANLKDIAIAGGAVPLVSGGVLGFHYAAPRVALDTATDADLADGDLSVTAMASWRDRINAVVPKYRSAAHNWELVDADKVTVSTYVTEDGEEKAEVFAYNLVKSKDQAAQLAAYRLVDGRELQPIEITYGPRLFAYGPGDCLYLDHPELGLDGSFVILKRSFDPATMTVTFTFVGETAAKHAYALGQSGTPPATPALGQSSEDRDELKYVVSPVPEDPGATRGAIVGDNLRLIDDSVPTQGQVITAEGTAAAITGQTAWATYSGDNPTTYSQRVQYLDTSGQLSALNRVADRRLTLLRRDDGSTPLTEAMAITSLGTAAAIAGQGPFATTPLPVSRLTQIRPNLFPYPQGVDDGRSAAAIGWFNTAPGAGFSNLTMGRTSWTDGG
ncbi:MAG: phage tail protein, partial [Pseudomonadota bacterium]